MVAVDDDLRPVAVAPLTPIGQDEERRYREAGLRKKLRAELADRFSSIRDHKPEVWT